MQTLMKVDIDFFRFIIRALAKMDLQSPLGGPCIGQMRHMHLPMGNLRPSLGHGKCCKICVAATKACHSEGVQAHVCALRKSEGFDELLRVSRSNEQLKVCILKIHYKLTLTLPGW